MVIAYIKPIDPEVGYKDTLLGAAKYLKELKKWVIQEVISDVLGDLFSYEVVKDRIAYKYEGVRGQHIFILDGKELIHFEASEYKVNKKNELECSFEYKLLYKEGR